MKTTHAMYYKQDVYAEEAWNPGLHIIALTDGSVLYNSYHSSRFFEMDMIYCHFNQSY